MPQLAKHHRFILQFDPAKLREIASRYPAGEDAKALAAGVRIRAGTYTRVELIEIFEWKTKGRGKSRLALNTDAEITDALELASQAATDRAALAVLCGLHGVDVPVASAILTAIDPLRFTVIDFRALAALGCSTIDRSVPSYLAYLQACRVLAAAHKASLRDLDRALWQWSSEQP